jgi:tryptophan 2,3-dioxygenase
MRNELWCCLHEILDPEQTHYCEYINLGTLLNSANPNSGTNKERDFIHIDEAQFVAVHQMIEIGFNFHIQTLKQLIGVIEMEDYQFAIKLTDRLAIWCKIYSNIMSAFSTMDPQDFATFRDQLTPASGAESEQFRSIEILSGIQPNDQYATSRGVEYTYREFLDRPPEQGIGKPKTRWWTKRLSELSCGQTVRKVFNIKFAMFNLEPWNLADETIWSTHTIVQLRNSLINYDKAFSGFRWKHLMIGARQISTLAGTGHTEGIPYLQSTINTARFFPELWDG